MTLKVPRRKQWSPALGRSQRRRAEWDREEGPG